MRILHLAWEYPPVMYGGLGRHVHALANAQAALGHDVIVITQAPPGGRRRLAQLGADDPDDGPVQVLRAGGEPAAHDDLLGHVAHMEWAFSACGEDLLASWTPDVIHAHDWMVSHAAVTLRWASGAPLVATIHATEAGRNQGWVTSPLSTTIHSIEWWLANTADAVIACSRAMAGEIQQLFGVPVSQVIPNGIDPAEWTRPPAAMARLRDAHGDADPLLAYTGRVEWEKGVQTVLEAMPALRLAYPEARLLVAGRGSYLPTLQERARDLGLGDAARFLGWVSEEDLRAVVAISDVAIAPSLYEPFGLVALEAAALGTPVVVADTGGLAEFAAEGKHAVTFRSGDPVSLVQAIRADLADPDEALARAERATEALALQYDWGVIAQATTEAYDRAAELLGSPANTPQAQRAAARRELERPRFAAPMGHLLGPVA